ncbi:MAG: LytR C-terminal domain-containing protein [Elusimicrobiota bacterium]
MRLDRVLAALLIVLLGAAVRVDRGSVVSAALRRSEPVLAMLALRTSSQQPVLPPAVYLAVYTPRERSLDLVLMTPATPVSGGLTLADVYASARDSGRDPQEAGKQAASAAWESLRASPAWPSGTAEPVLCASLTLPPEASPAFPERLKSLLLQSSRDPLFWPLFWGRMRPRLPEAERGLGPYDAFLLARLVSALAPDDIRLSRLPEAGLLNVFLPRLLFRRESERVPEAHLTAEVLNASGKGGVALRATKLLRWHEFDVIHFGNAQAPTASTRVVDRVGRPEAARAILRCLGCGDVDVVTAMEDTPQADISITLGRDFERCSRLAGDDPIASAE